MTEAKKLKLVKAFVFTIISLGFGGALTMFQYHRGAELPQEFSALLAGKEVIRTTRLQMSSDVFGDPSSERSLLLVVHMSQAKLALEFRNAINTTQYKEQKAVKGFELISFSGPQSQQVTLSRGYHLDNGKFVGREDYTSVFYSRPANDFELRFDKFFHSGKFRSQSD